MEIKIDLYFKNKEWSKNDIIQDKEIFSKIVSKILKTIEAVNLCKVLSFDLTFVSDAIIEEYNLKFRNKAKATNVLSFPTENFLRSDLKKFKMENLYLGEIIFSFETIKKESERQNKTFRDHLLHLFTHAFLHLLCYEHDSKKEQQEMEELEILVLKNFGIKNPYESSL
ncbi:MAG: rRNA maturation RNase YbeY [Rickettsiales bacterium]|nr:rRNA maturation RNase YbeY [Rickettsiales bacterium]